MKVRRTSGEIVALTMMEVFVTFIFALLAFSTIREVKPARMEQAVADQKVLIGDLEARLRQLDEDTKRLRDERDLHAARARRLEDERDALREKFLSEFPPKCPPAESPVIDIVLKGDDTLDVTLNTDLLSGRYVKGTRLTLSGRQFSSYARPLVDDGRSRRCKYLVQLRDSDTITKREFIRTEKTIRRDFYAYVHEH